MAEELEDAPWIKQQQSTADLPDAPWATTEPKPAPTWSEVPGQALRNAPHSAWEFAKNVAAPVADVGEYGARGIDWLAQKVGAEPRAPQPTPTLTGMSEIGQGVMQKLGIMGGEEHVGKADAVGKFLMDRYGSVEGIKKTMAEDPVGLAADVSTVLSGGAMLAGRVPGVGGVLSKAARVTDPLTLVGKATSPILSLGSEALGLTTGAGGEAVRLAGRAGLEGGEAASSFERNLRGVAPMEEAVVESRQAASALRNKRNAAYNKEMADITASTPQGHKLLQLDDIDKALTDTADIGKYKGRVVDPEAAAAHQKLSGIVDEWRKDPIHTIEDIDKLKQTMGGILKDADANSREKLVAGKIYDAAKQTIVKADPRYAKAMEGYSKSTELLDELDRTLSLKDTATVDTTLRKLQSVLRDNVNTSYGRRKELAQFIVDNGAPNLLYKLAGQSLKSAAPRGLARLSTAIGAEIAAALGLAVSHTPAIGAALAAAPLMSPRAVGEAAYGAGKIVGGARPLMKPSYLTGRLVTDPAGFKKGGRVTKTFRYQEGGRTGDENFFAPGPENSQAPAPSDPDMITQTTPEGGTWSVVKYDSPQVVGWKSDPREGGDPIIENRPNQVRWYEPGPNEVWSPGKPIRPNPLSYMAGFPENYTSKSGLGGGAMAFGREHPGFRSQPYNIMDLTRRGWYGNIDTTPFQAGASGLSRDNPGGGVIMRNSNPIDIANTFNIQRWLPGGMNAFIAPGDAGGYTPPVIGSGGAGVGYPGARAMGTYAASYWPGQMDLPSIHSTPTYWKGGRVTKTFRYADGGRIKKRVLRRQGGGPTATGEPPEGMFARAGADASEALYKDPVFGVSYDRPDTREGMNTALTAQDVSFSPNGTFSLNAGDPQTAGFISAGAPGTWRRGTDWIQEVTPGQFQSDTTNNPMFAAARGYYGSPYIMRRGHVINVAKIPVDTAQSVASLTTASDPRKGGQAFFEATGYPFGRVNITGVAYPQLEMFWPGQMEEHATYDPHIENRGGRIKAKKRQEGGAVKGDNPYAGKTIGDIFSTVPSQAGGYGAYGFWGPYGGGWPGSILGVHYLGKNELGGARGGRINGLPSIRR